MTEYSNTNRTPGKDLYTMEELMRLRRERLRDRRLKKVLLISGQPCGMTSSDGLIVLLDAAV